MTISYVYFADVIGGSGTPYGTSNYGTITCMAPKAANPLSVEYKGQIVTGPDESSVFNRYNRKFDQKTYYST